jgi:hypothetical protein
MVAPARRTWPASTNALTRLRETAWSEAASQRSSRSPAAASSAVSSTRSPPPPMAERLDRNHATLKAVVIGMGVLIVVGFAVVVFEITRRLSNMGEEDAFWAGDPLVLEVPQGCTLAEIAGVGERLALRLEPASSCPDLIYLDASGREVGRVELQPAP